MALFALTAFSGSSYDVEELRSPVELIAILTLFYTMMFLMVFAAGSSSSNTPMFTLSDVTLLFPAPLSSNKILVYGLVRQLGLSLVLGFFILFQYSWMHGVYGVEVPGLLLVILGYGLTLFFAQLSSMAVYVRTSGNEAAAKAARYCVFGAAAPVRGAGPGRLPAAPAGSGPGRCLGARRGRGGRLLRQPARAAVPRLRLERRAGGGPSSPGAGPGGALRPAAFGPVRPAAGIGAHLQEQLLRGRAGDRGDSPVRRHCPEGRGS